MARLAVGFFIKLARRVDGAIRRYVFVIGETPRTHVAELPSRGISRGGKSKHQCDRKCGLGNRRHNSIPCEETCENSSLTPPPYVNAELPRLLKPIRNPVQANSSCNAVPAHGEYNGREGTMHPVGPPVPPASRFSLGGGDWTYARQESTGERIRQHH